MPDYDCYPLWRHGDGQVGNIDPNTLVLSKSLIKKLAVWKEEYDHTLNRSNPIESGFLTKEAEVKFVATGYELAVELKAELKHIEITYYDIDQRRERKI